MEQNYSKNLIKVYRKNIEKKIEKNYMYLIINTMKNK